MVRRATPEERRDLVAQVVPRARRIQEYIEDFGVLSVEKPMSDEAARVMDLWQAAEEAQAYDGIQ